MPKVKIHNLTKVAGTLIPNGVVLEITIGEQKSKLAVAQTGTYEVARDTLIKIEPTNTMMKKANWMSDGTTSDLYIIPADEDKVFGVKIRYDAPDD
jgi:hypothetical protein